jgi:serine/threonine protein kinase
MSIRAYDSSHSLMMRAKCCRRLVSLCEEHALLPTGMILRNIHISSYIPVAVGGYGTVYQAIYNGALVAVKALRRLADDGGKTQRVRHTICLSRYPRLKSPQRFHREVVTWSQLKHRRIQPVLGVVDGHFGGLCMISPWCENGDAIAYLRSHARSSALILKLVS